MSAEARKLTIAAARELTNARRAAAVAEVLAGYGVTDPSVVDKVIAAYKGVGLVLPDDCDDVHPEYGRCVNDYGHKGPHYTTEYLDNRRPDGSHPWDY